MTTRRKMPGPGGTPRKKKIQGIYKIENPATGEVYIGQSTNIHHRWKMHKLDLYLGRHPNYLLTKAHERYGVFKYEILEIVEDKKRLTERERHYVREYSAMGSGYNLTIPGEYPPRYMAALRELAQTTEKEARLIRETHRDRDIEDTADLHRKKPQVVRWIAEGSVFTGVEEHYEPCRDGVRHLTGDQKFMEDLDSWKIHIPEEKTWIDRIAEDNKKARR